MPCGITCPTGTGLTTFLFKLLCGFGNWMLCHALSFIIVIIIFVVVYFYWTTRSEKIKGRWKIYSYIALMIFLLMVFYPSIKALLFTSLFETALTIQNYYYPTTNNYYIRNGRLAEILIEVKNPSSTTYARVSCTFKDPENLYHTNTSDCEQISGTKNYTVYQFMEKDIIAYGNVWYLDKCEVRSATKTDCSDYIKKEYTGINKEIWNVPACDDFTTNIWCYLFDSYMFSDMANDSYGNDKYYNVPCYEGNREVTIILTPITPSSNINMSVLWVQPTTPPTPPSDCDISVDYPNTANCTGTCVSYSKISIQADLNTHYNISIINGQP